jgi:tight adherence protein B
LAAQVPEALELMAGALRAGRSIRQCLPAGAAVGPPLGPVWERASHRAGRGQPLPSVLEAAGSEEPGVQPAAAALAVCLTSGGDAARSLDRLAAVERAREDQRGEVRSLTAQARLSGAVLGALPLVALGLFTITGGSERAFLASGGGQVCLAVGLALDGAGYLILRRMGAEA